MPAKASAFWSTRAPATVTGAIAPARVNGVMTMHWLRADISWMPWSITVSYRSGVLALITE